MIPPIILYVDQSDLDDYVSRYPQLKDATARSMRRPTVDGLRVNGVYATSPARMHEDFARTVKSLERSMSLSRFPLRVA